MPDISTTQLPEAAYAYGAILPHHTDAVVKGTENKSVDIDMLKTALGDVASADIPANEKQGVIEHLTAHAKALDLSDEEVEGLIGDVSDDVPQYQDQIEAVNSFVDAENLLLTMLEADAPEEMLAKAEARVQQFAQIDRELVVEEFDGIVEKTEQGEDGLWHFTARVAQAEKCNKNKRMYPKEEFENNLPRVNRLCKAGRFTGRDGHASWLSDDKPSEICVRYDAVMLQDNDLLMDGVLVPTQAGQDLAALWAAGVQFEWSIVGYGRAESKTDEKGNWEYDVIHDYILDGCDPVRRGAASTRTLKVKKPSDAVEAETTADSVVEETLSDSVDVPEVVPSVEEPIMGEEVNTEVQEEQKPEVAPIDVEAIKAEISADAKAQAKAMVEQARIEAKLEAAKETAIAKLADGDELVVKVVEKFINAATTVEEVAAAVEEATPLAEKMKTPKAVPSSGVFIHKDQERARFMLDGTGQVIDRPSSVHEVKEALLAGLEDNGRNDASNKRWTMERIIENYEQSKENSRYLWAMTKQGFAETATTTGALGTTLPMVLPMVRQVLPQLIPYAIGAVVPIDRPTARVYFYDPQYKTGTNGSGADGSNLDDSSVFDTGWADHTENDTKSQITFAMTHTDVTATEKAVYWDLTSTVIQDMAAIYNMDAEASMLSAATDYLALEINMKYIETLVAGAGINVGTFGTALPASGFENLSEWLTWGLSQYLNRASSLISKKMYQSAGWVLTGPTQATVFEASKSYEKVPAGAVKQFGQGARMTGTLQNLFDVYVVDWAETIGLKNKMLIGYTPADWNRASAVFCPYIPFYLSPMDSNASINTISRSASSRNAYKVLQANGLATMTISSAAGTALTYVD